MRVVYKHPMRRSRCFVFDNLFEVAKFLHSQNQSVQLRLICKYMPTTTPAKVESAWEHDKDIYKSRIASYDFQLIL